MVLPVPVCYPSTIKCNSFYSVRLSRADLDKRRAYLGNQLGTQNSTETRYCYFHQWEDNRHVVLQRQCEGGSGALNCNEEENRNRFLPTNVSYVHRGLSILIAMLIAVAAAGAVPFTAMPSRDTFVDRDLVETV